MESELLHTYSKVDPFDVLILCVRVAVLIAVTLTVPIVLFPVSQRAGDWAGWRESLKEATTGLIVPPPAQVRRAIQQMLFQNQEFSWLRHVLIATGLLTCINLLVIFAPNILGIFGIIGESLTLLGEQGRTTESFTSTGPGRPLISHPTFMRAVPCVPGLASHLDACLYYCSSSFILKAKTPDQSFLIDDGVDTQVKVSTQDLTDLGMVVCGVPVILA